MDGAGRLDRPVPVLADGGHELERDAVHVGVLGGEQAVLVRLVGAAAQAAADDLLAQQLGAERPDAEDVGDGVGVPALGEHRDRDDAADRLAELSGLADGVHHLPHDLPVVHLLGLPAGDTAGVFATELLDLGRGDLLELRGQALAGLELDGVDEDGARTRDRLAVVDVGEQRELAGHPDGLVVAEGLLPPGDVVVDHLGDGGVVADDDEDGGRLAVLLRVGVLPRGERFRVGVVKRVERGFEQTGHLIRR